MDRQFMRMIDLFAVDAGDVLVDCSFTLMGIACDTFNNTFTWV